MFGGGSGSRRVSATEFPVDHHPSDSAKLPMLSESLAGNCGSNRVIAFTSVCQGDGIAPSPAIEPLASISSNHCMLGFGAELANGESSSSRVPS
jgi:hypothetical protein